MKKLLLTNRYSGQPLKILLDAINGDFELLMLDEVSQEALRAQIGNADYLLVSGRLKVGKPEIDLAPSLKMVQRTGVGLDTIDLDYLQKSGIPLYVNRGINSTSVAEHAVFLILSVLRKSYIVNRNMRSGIWKKQETGLQTHELHGKTVGIVGLGNIGQAVARILYGFGANVLYYDQKRLCEEQEQQLHVTYCEFEPLLQASDIVTLHCSLEDNNKKLISSREIALMKQGSILINTSRGSLVDTNAVIAALDAEKFMGVGFDVFEREPLNQDSLLLHYDNAILSPHIGGVTYEAFSHMMTAAVDNIRAFQCEDYERIAPCRIV